MFFNQFVISIDKVTFGSKPEFSTYRPQLQIFLK